MTKQNLQFIFLFNLKITIVHVQVIWQWIINKQGVKSWIC